MIAFIQLTIAGADSGPFNLYSDTDGFTVAFGPSIVAAVLLAGYLSMDVPNGTTTIRVVSTGVCKNFLDIPLVLPDPVPCGGSVSVLIIGGTVGIKDNIINLAPVGGVVSLIIQPTTDSSKVEIIHNGVKKATTAMTGANGGPFDNVYGMSPGYVIPTDAAVAAIDQFLDTAKGAIPNRNAAYLAETGINYITAPAGRQMVWWKYSSADYLNGNQAIVRAVTSTTGVVSGTSECESTTTTTTTTAVVTLYDMILGTGVSSTTSACATSGFITPVKADAEFPFNGNHFFELDGVTPFNGLNKWYMINHMPGIIFRVSSLGLIVQYQYCP